MCVVRETVRATSQEKRKQKQIQSQSLTNRCILLSSSHKHGRGPRLATKHQIITEKQMNRAAKEPRGMHSRGSYADVEPRTRGVPTAVPPINDSKDMKTQDTVPNRLTTKSIRK